MVESTLGHTPTRSFVKDCYRVRGTVIDVLPGGTRLIVFRDPSNIIRIMDFLHTIHVVSKRFVEENLKHLGFGLNIPGPPNHISLASLLCLCRHILHNFVLCLSHIYGRSPLKKVSVHLRQWWRNNKMKDGI